VLREKLVEQFPHLAEKFEGDNFNIFELPKDVFCAFDLYFCALDNFEARRYLNIEVFNNNKVLFDGASGEWRGDITFRAYKIA
jgi:molybdopterin/thiamine biosynthesis adenylyltransferase